MQTWKVPIPVRFEWDEGNLEKNRLKHGVTPKEVEEIFFNKPLIVSINIKHVSDEERYQALGKTHGDRALFVVFTMRNTDIRVISARDQNTKEFSYFLSQHKKS